MTKQKKQTNLSVFPFLCVYLRPDGILTGNTDTEERMRFKE